LEELGVEAYKIASFELVDVPLLQYVASKGKPMILSCGMATKEEIQEALETVYATGNTRVVLLKCSSEYPANPSNLNLATIADMKERFQVPVGFSDHTLGSESAVVAVSLGACVVEKHFCLSRKLKGPDSAFSMEPHEFAELVKKVHEAKKIVGNISYGASEKEKNSLVFRRSVFAVKDIQKGERFTEENIRVIRPGYGLRPKYYPALLGLPSKEKVERGTPIQLDSIKPGCILFLTNNRNTRNVYHWLREQEEIFLLKDPLTLELVQMLRPSFIISFNYRHMITKDVIAWMQGRIINLHLSLLPWNRGASPNFFSFYDDTPKGVTIHYVDQGIDTGEILCQREILLDETKESFASSYQFLMKQMEELFVEHWQALKNGSLLSQKQSKIESYHTTAELKRIQQVSPFRWEDNISEFKKKYQIGG
jgi:folate-dependent phosphoribosylglycinamide formyltransferase PurN